MGVNDGVRDYILRRSGKRPITYDHPQEERALQRTPRVILFQDQVNQLAIDVAGFSLSEADQLRRAFGKRNNQGLLASYWERFRQGALQRGVPEATARKIFLKFNGQYMFPESHAFAFGVTAYQAAWLKLYYPLEFYTAILNQQPMGFYSPETLKEDARRHGVEVLHPDINKSKDRRDIEGNSVRLGLLYVRDIGEAAAQRILQERQKAGLFSSLADFMSRTGLQREPIENLVETGAFDTFSLKRRQMLWEVGLRYQAAGIQISMVLPMQQDMVRLPDESKLERMLNEYQTMRVHPEGHLMEHIRPRLPREVIPAGDVLYLPDGQQVAVAGLVIRRQRPLGKAAFITLEDETGLIPLVAWPNVYENYKRVLANPLVLVKGRLSRRDGTLNIEVISVNRLSLPYLERETWFPLSRDFR